VPLTRLLLRAAGLDAGIPQYATIGLEPNELDVRATLHRGSLVLDVSSCCSIASLKPLRLVVSTPQDQGGPATLMFWERRRRGSLVLGDLELEPAGVCGPDGNYRLYGVSRHRNVAVERKVLYLAYARYEVDRLKRLRSSDAFLIGGLDLWSVLVFYSRPRPVVVVSVAANEAANLFPMDLIGPTADDRFLMALRSSSPNIGVIQRSRRMAMAEVPHAFATQAYSLASGHKRLRKAGETLPFATLPSPRWELPLPREARRVREVEVEHIETVGSHQLMTTRVVSDSSQDGERLHHISGLYERALKLRE
jgi:flavin reductase (DIM6/NTAB) family NADH-FMN oxidoreductase RutF